MSDYQTYWLSPDFLFEKGTSRAGLELSDVVSEAIEKIWEREKQSQPQLFNGKVLSLIEFDEKRLMAEFVEYKRFLAYIREPLLRKKLKMKPLSLSCITITEDKVLFGRRSKAVMQYPLWYELAPSGGIDEAADLGMRIDVVGQSLRELKEEIGFLKEDVLAVKPFALVYDKISDMYELCVEIRIKPGQNSLSQVSTPEYDELLWVANSLRLHSKNIVPFSLHLLSLISKDRTIRG